MVKVHKGFYENQTRYREHSSSRCIFMSIVQEKTSSETQYRGRQVKQGFRWYALRVKTLMGVLCARTLKSIYIIADRLSPNIDWSGFSILFFSLFPSNRHPLVPSYISLIRPITAAYITAECCDTMPVYLETRLRHGYGFSAVVQTFTLATNRLKMLGICRWTSKKSLRIIKKIYI